MLGAQDLYFIGLLGPIVYGFLVVLPILEALFKGVGARLLRFPGIEGDK